MDIEKVKLEIGDVYVTIISQQEIFGLNNIPDDLIINITVNQKLLRISYLISNLCFIEAIQELENICKQLNLDLTECVNLTYEKIKNRKGKTINGSFFRD